MRRYWPILSIALILWATIVWARTVPGNPMTGQRVAAILITAGCWFTIGAVIERIRNGGD